MASAKKPRRRGTGRARPSARRELLTLSEIGRRTGISYPTLLRYVRDHLGMIPHTGKGRERRYRPSAVAVFQGLRARTNRGRRAVAPTGATPAGPAVTALTRRVVRLERENARVTAELKRLTREMRKPLKLTVKR